MPAHELGTELRSEETETHLSLEVTMVDSTETGAMEAEEQIVAAPVGDILGSLVREARLRNGRDRLTGEALETEGGNTGVTDGAADETEALTTSLSPSAVSGGRDVAPLQTSPDVRGNVQVELAGDTAHQVGQNAGTSHAASQDKHFSVMMILFENEADPGTVSGRAKMKISSSIDRSVTKIIRRMLEPTPTGLGHGLSYCLSGQYKSFALATSRVPSIQRIGRSPFQDQPGHQFLGLFGKLVRGEAYPLVDNLEPMDQTAPQTQSFLDALPPNVPRKWFEGVVYVLYLVRMSNDATNVRGDRPNAPRSPSPSRIPILQRPNGTPTTNVDTAVDRPLQSRSSPTPPTANEVGMAVERIEDPGHSHARSSRRRSRRNEPSTPRSRRPNSSQTREMTQDPNFHFRSAFLNAQFPRIHQILSGDVSLQDLKPIISIAWFFQRMQLLNEVATTLGMPELQETNVYIVRDVEGWDGRVTADNVVAWFASHP
ncbi:hypothetical protein CALVIDRAFT_568439 [Calocera viscosa TUFC12733]|uniref:Uncharacterized protein n=1 Tax=Calocera viscosa (strain TUFC12733) TaxID=1330018 RepID=A0A167H2Q9_CALVF|nr:hypothetical protein CALVIDRAFT_568439 [Calocera viscosa TUFC12733]